MQGNPAPSVALVRRVVRIDNDLTLKPGFEAGSLARDVKHAIWKWVDGIWK